MGPHPHPFHTFEEIQVNLIVKLYAENITHSAAYFSILPHATFDSYKRKKSPF